MYIGSALFFFVVAGSMASVIRMQLALPNNDLIGPGTFNRLFTMHGTSMVFLFGMPIIAGLMNYLVPLMIGARDMAFPRLNAFGFWMFLFGGVLLYSSYLTAPGLDRGRFGAGRGLVRLFAADGPGLLTREQHGLLDSQPADRRHRQHRLRH